MVEERTKKARRSQEEVIVLESDARDHGAWMTREASHLLPESNSMLALGMHPVEGE